MSGNTIQLETTCRATRIPSGEEVELPAGNEFSVSQALGGSVTLKDGANLYRVAIEDLDALGEAFAASIRASESGQTSDAPFSEEAVWDALRQCFDPEIPINIVDLGLIYDLIINELEGGHFSIGVKMTLTATGCGMGPAIAADAKAKIENLPAVESAEVDIVWDPQWTPHMISDEGRKVLGLD
jgi:probable FeS assembly SUF system protein SufT